MEQRTRKNRTMSNRSGRSSDRDRSLSSSFSSHTYDKYDYRHRRDNSRYRNDDYRHRDRRDDSRDRSDRHHSKKKSRHEHSRSRYRSRSRSRSNSRHHDSYYSRSSHKSKEHKELPGSSMDKNIDSINGVHNMPPDDNYRKKDISELNIVSSSDLDPSTSTSTSFELGNENTQSVPATTETPANPYGDDDEDPELREERERIQKETLERLQKHLQNEGKKYPPPKPQASHPIFANDGSFLEMFKSMQGNLQQQHRQQQTTEIVTPVAVASTTKPTVIVPRLPAIKRRGGKILKTGIVQKQRTVDDGDENDASDSWNAYLKEVKKYKKVSCGDDNITRPLVK